MRLEYTATLDRTAKVITTAVLLLLAGIPLFNFFVLGKMSDETPLLALVLSVVTMIVVFVGAFLFRPVKYILEEDKIIIKRPISDVVIPIAEVTNASLPDNDSMKWSLRTFGSGGVFGYYGKFWNKSFGSMTWYATRRENFLLIRTRDKRKILLTPDDPEMGTRLQSLIDSFSR